MKAEVREITRALNDASVRYVIAGGLAVIAHGYMRMTMDIDLVIDLERDNLLRALDVLEKVGYTPRLPVTKKQFADVNTRESWIHEKHMLVFPLWNPAEKNSMLIDVFVKCPFDFADEYTKAKRMDFDGQRIPFVGLDCLLKMKADAARPKDLADIDMLKKARDEAQEE